MKYLITAFGGGHTSLALACMKKIKGRTSFVILRHDDLSRKKMDALQIEYQTVIEPRSLGESLLSPHVWFRFWLNALQSLKILVREKPDIIVSTGPNPSIPISLLAKMIRKKLVNVEVVDRIIKPSLTARILSFFADETWVHWKEQKTWFKNAKLVGPLFFEQKSGIKIDLPHPIIAVFSGRRFHGDLLDAVNNVSNELDFSWIIQTAGGSVKGKKGKIVMDYFEGISDLIEHADLVVTTGGLTAFETLAKGKPLVLYPRKDTSAEHQVEQAVYLSKLKNCWYVKDKEELKLQLFKIRERYK